MSQHPSLKSDSVGARHRNVLKRHERIRVLEENERLEGRSSAFNLPKLKLIKLKVKKAKGPKEGEGQQAEGQAASGTSAAAPAAKAAAKPASEKAKGKEKA